MNPLVLEWIEKAEGDYFSALREYRARKTPNYDAACFHAQQAVEKYLKAILQAREIPFRKTHDLTILFDLFPEIPEGASLRPDLHLLTQYAVAFRYPGESATKEQAKEAVKSAGKLRKTLRMALQLPEES
jgi:HEPN domain-containing protein